MTNLRLTSELSEARSPVNDRMQALAEAGSMLIRAQCRVAQAQVKASRWTERLRLEKPDGRTANELRMAEADLACAQKCLADAEAVHEAATRDSAARLNNRP